MRDVSVRVGGLNGAAIPGAYASAFNHSGEINSEGGQMVMVENYSPLPFQIGLQLIPPMSRRTFGIDNYPKLQWTVTGQVANPAFFIGLCETRTVRIIIDPVTMLADGPVYPPETLTCISGFLKPTLTTYPPNGLTTAEWMIDVYSLLSGFTNFTGYPGGGSTVLPPAMLDAAIMKFEFYAPKELQVASITKPGSIHNPFNLKYASLPPAVYLAVGAGAPLTKFADFGQTDGLTAAGRDITVRTKIPGASLIVVSFGGQGLPDVGFGCNWRAWCGWHL